LIVSRWHDCDSSGQTSRSLDFTRTEGFRPAHRIALPVMQSRVCCDWLLRTRTPLSQLCSEQMSDVACRTLIAHSKLGVTALLWASERASALTSTLCSPRKAVTSACALSRPSAPYPRELLPTDALNPAPHTTYPYASSCKGSELLAVCIYPPAAMHALSAVP